jgi:outer membrane protein OmpA-like peptidoglycan-associated protein
MSRDVVVSRHFALALGVISFAVLLSSESFARRPPPTATCNAQPAEVMEGGSVELSASGYNFNPKHALTYTWITNAGKLQAPNTQSTSIDTTGIAAGSYTANATITDPKEKKNNVAACPANFIVRAKPMNPPQVSCSVNPPVVQAGMPVTITSTVSSPDGVPISGVTYQASAGRVTSSGNTATEDTIGVAPGSVTTMVTATDERNLTGTGRCSFTVGAAPHVATLASIQFPDKTSRSRVDNSAKAILNDIAGRLKADPNAKIAIVGYAAGERVATESVGSKRHPNDLAAQRAVNAKAYLVQQQGINPVRIDVRTGNGKSQMADIDWIPQGAEVPGAPVLQDTTEVNESVVRPTQGQ